MNLKSALPLLVAALVALASSAPGDAAAASVKKAARHKVEAKKTAVSASKSSSRASHRSHMSRKQRVAANKAARQRAAAAAAAKELNHYATDDDGNPLLRSAAVVVQDQSSGTVLFEKNAGAVLPIASITKLMTAMVVLDSNPKLHETLSIDDDDVDTLRGSRSRLSVGTRLAREEMLRLALMSSENRAASSLARHYPGGRTAFVDAMNKKAADLGLGETRFFDSTGLNAGNVSSARDLAKMVVAASKYPLIREFSTGTEYAVDVNGRTRVYHNTNALVSSPDWEIGVSKTGYINEAGRCLVMQAWLNQKPMIIVLLDSWGKLTRLGDANRIKRWIESASLNAGHAS